MDTNKDSNEPLPEEWDFSYLDEAIEAAKAEPVDDVVEGWKGEKEFYESLGGWTETYGWAYVCDHPDTMIPAETTVEAAFSLHGKKNILRMVNLGVYVWDGADTLRRPQHQSDRPPTMPARLDQGGWNPNGLIRDMGAQPEGKRNAFLFWAALTLLEDQDEFEITEEEIEEALYRLAVAAVDSGLGDREIERTIRSAQKRYAGG